MNTIHVLLVENVPTLKPRLEQSLTAVESDRFTIESVVPRNAEASFPNARRPSDVVLFSEALPERTVVRLAEAYRAQGFSGHLIALTRESEARVSPGMRKAGVDDILNVMEIETPVFAWTFMSALHTVGIKKKAKEYEVIQQRLQALNTALDGIARNMNTPMTAIRKISRQMGTNGHSIDPTPAMRRQLATNIEMLDGYLKDLLEIRSRLGKETRVINKYLAVKQKGETTR